MIPVERASHPWSNSSPSGELLPVRRACLPSIASKAWYPNKPSIANKHAQAGIFYRQHGMTDRKKDNKKEILVCFNNEAKVDVLSNKIKFVYTTANNRLVAKDRHIWKRK